MNRKAKKKNSAKLTEKNNQHFLKLVTIVFK